MISEKLSSFNSDMPYHEHTLKWLSLDSGTCILRLRFHCGTITGRYSIASIEDA